MENLNMDYEKVLKESEELSRKIEALAENEVVRDYIESCERQKNLEEIIEGQELYKEFISSKQRRALVLSFQNMCYDYDIVL